VPSVEKMNPKSNAWLTCRARRREFAKVAIELAADFSHRFRAMQDSKTASRLERTVAVY